MNKISILDQFAQDAINAPAIITGGKACKKKSKSKSKKSKCKSAKSKSSKSKSSKSKSRSNACSVPPPCKW